MASERAVHDDYDEQPMRECNVCGGSEPGWRDVVCPFCGEGIMQVQEDTLPAPAKRKAAGR